MPKCLCGVLLWSTAWFFCSRHHKLHILWTLPNVHIDKCPQEKPLGSREEVGPLTRLLPEVLLGRPHSKLWSPQAAQGLCVQHCKAIERFISSHPALTWTSLSSSYEIFFLRNIPSKLLKTFSWDTWGLLKERTVWWHHSHGYPLSCDQF